MISLDDVNVSSSERSSESSKFEKVIASTSEITMMIHLQEMTGLNPPSSEEYSDGRPKDEYSYLIEANFEKHFTTRFVCADAIQWSPDIIDFISSCLVSMPVSVSSRDAFDGFLVLTLVEKKFVFVPVPRSD
ncbi:hypothetical protein HDU82_006293, partial [Entophlyctis luteolus]